MTAIATERKWPAREIAFPWREVLLATAPVVVLGTILLARGLVLGPTLDGAVFALIGDAVAHGALPYRDLWDHKPPGIYLVNGVAGLALPMVDAWVRAWLVSWLSTMGAVAVLALLLVRAGQRWYGIAAAMLVALPLLAGYHFVLGGGQTESVGLLGSVAGIGLVVSARRSGWIALGGILLGAAVLVSVQFIPALLAAVVVAALGPSRVRHAGAVIVGSAVVPLLALGWIWADGALPAMLDQVLAYNRAYLAGNQQYRDKGLVWAGGDALFLLPLVAAALARIAALRRIPPTRLEIAAVVWLASGVVLVFFQGLYFAHYLVALAPPLVILAAPALGSLFEAAARRPRPVLATSLAIAFLALPGLLGLALTEPTASSATSAKAAAALVGEMTHPVDPVFVWGNDAAFYLDARRPVASRFVYMFPLTAPGYASPELVAGIQADWERHPPAVIVDATTNPGRVGGYPLTSTADPTVDGVLDPLRAWVMDRYRLATSTGGWDLYVPKDGT